MSHRRDSAARQWNSGSRCEEKAQHGSGNPDAASKRRRSTPTERALSQRRESAARERKEGCRSEERAQHVNGSRGVAAKRERNTRTEIAPPLLPCLQLVDSKK